MPKPGIKIKINLNLLKPQSNPEKLLVRIVKWLLSSGRFIFIAVEALVLIAFIARFKLDADLQSRKEAIDAQIPYIKDLKPYEILIRQTHLKLSTIDGFKKTQADYANILKSIADQTPMGVKISNLTLNNQPGKVTVTISGQARTNIDISAFLMGLKSNKKFSGIELVSVGVETGSLNFAANLISNAGLRNNGL